MADNEQQRRVHYVHRISYTVQERLVGVFILGAMAVIFSLFFINSKTAHLFEDTVTYHAYLSNAAGISTETLVKVSGLEVGRVIDVGISEDNRIHVTLEVYERFQRLVRRDSAAAVGKLSILGKSTIEIEAGSPDQPMLPDGSLLQVDEPLSVDQLVAELTPVLASVKESVEGLAATINAIEPTRMEETFQALHDTASNLSAITTHIASGEGFVGTAIYDEQFDADMQQMVAALEGSLQQAEARLAQLEPVLGNVDAITAEARQTTHQLPELVEDVRTLIGQMNTTLATFNSEIRHFPDLVNRMKALIDQTDRTLEGILRSWPFGGAEDGPNQQLIETRPYHD